MHTKIIEQVAYLTFDKPERANALDVAGWHDLRAAVTAAAANEAVRVIVLGGQGKHFCAGIDLNVLGDIQQFRGDGARVQNLQKLQSFIADLQSCITVLESCPKPVIAAVQGGCIGGGVDIVTACDLRYCTDDAYFTVKEVDLGIIADLGTLQRLPYIVGPGLAAELSYTARRVYGPEAAAIRLVNRSFPDHAALLAGVGELAATIARKPPAVIMGVKHSLRYGRDHGVTAGLEEVARASAKLMLEG